MYDLYAPEIIEKNSIHTCKTNAKSVCPCPGSEPSRGTKYNYILKSVRSIKVECGISIKYLLFVFAEIVKHLSKNSTFDKKSSTLCTCTLVVRHVARQSYELGCNNCCNDII